VGNSCQSLVERGCIEIARQWERGLLFEQPSRDTQSILMQHGPIAEYFVADAVVLRNTEISLYGRTIGSHKSYTISKRTKCVHSTAASGSSDFHRPTGVLRSSMQTMSCSLVSNTELSREIPLKICSTKDMFQLLSLNYKDLYRTCRTDLEIIRHCITDRQFQKLVRGAFFYAFRFLC